MSIVSVLAPEYYKNFECVGSDCEYTCCRGWTITIDEKTYEKYRKIDDKVKKNKKGFSPLTNNSMSRVKKNKKENNLNNYAIFNLKNNGDCPFLNGNRLSTSIKIWVIIICRILARHILGIFPWWKILMR